MHWPILRLDKLMPYSLNPSTCPPPLPAPRWPGGLGMSATHAALYAQLITKGVNHGFHVFLVQLRDEHHSPLPGVEVGEVGPKVRTLVVFRMCVLVVFHASH